MIRVIEELGSTYCHADVIHSSGPERVVYDQPDPAFKARPVGFVARLERTETEPLLWDGDGA